MGNVKDLVKQHITNGDRIVCDVGVNHLLTAGVSNWGGWALAMSVFLLNNCLLHSRYQRYGIGLHHEVRQEDILNSFNQVTASENPLIFDVVQKVILLATCNRLYVCFSTFEVLHCWLVSNMLKIS